MAGAGDVSQERVGQFPPRKKLSRLDFLHVVGVGAAAVGLAGCAPEVVQALEAPVFSFPEVKPNNVIPLIVDGTVQEVTVQYQDYRNGISYVSRRKISGAIISEAFTPGAEKDRKLGEIINNTVVFLEPNTELLGKGKVVEYETLLGPVATSGARKSLGSGPFTDLYGIQVVTGLVDDMDIGKNPPFEINSESLQATSNKVGEGWAVGHFSPDKTTFTIFGYVQDARALKAVQ